MPLVSVIIPTYNRAFCIKRAIDSVLGQAYQNLELIVIDDGSTDETSSIVNEYKKVNPGKNIYYIQEGENRGGNHVRNIGIEKSRGEYVCFLDSDDEWRKTKIQKQVNFMLKDNSVDVLYNLPEYCNNETGRKTKFDLRNAKKGGLYKELLRGWCPAITSCSMIRRRVLENTSNRFDENLTSYQDYDFWLTLAKNNHKFNYLPDYLTINHHHFQDQVSINIENRLNGLNKFFAKWQDEIKKELGNKELNYVYRKKEETVYFNYIVKEISKIYYQKTGGISKVFLLFNKNFILSIWKYFLVKMMRISRL